MSLIGQPESYSNILERIFAATLIAGILCTLAIAASSPAFSSFLESWNREVSFSILDNIKVLYILVPLVVAILARVFRFHNVISDVLKIRWFFDVHYILEPLAIGVGFPTKGPRWQLIEEKRTLAMTRAFYRFASFENPKIDLQLVRSAADQWAWFWCAVEPNAVLLITIYIFAMIGAWWSYVAGIGVLICLMLFAVSMWPKLEKLAARQVEEILSDEAQQIEVRTALDNLSPSA